MRVEDMTVDHHGRTISGRLYLPEKERFPIVIFSHGFNGWGDDFDTEARELAKNGIGAVTYDFCGGSLHSRSDLSTAEMTVFTEKEDLSAVMDAMQNRQEVDKDGIFLFGASMGGLVSALCAKERCDEIKGMVLLYPALCIADDWIKRFLQVEDIPPEGYTVWGVLLGAPFFRTLHGFDVFAHIGGFNKKVLIMHGEKDEVVPLEYSQRADGLYADSRLIVFPNEGHGFSQEGKEEATKLLVEYITESYYK